MSKKSNKNHHYDKNNMYFITLLLKCKEFSTQLMKNALRAMND
jgi:hypothetical protein